MKTFTALALAALLSAYASGGKHEVEDERQKLVAETRCYEAADVRAEVEERVRKGDLRFKGWTKGIADGVAFLPGISAEQGKSLERLRLPDAEVLYIEDVFPIVADVPAYEKSTAALFEYMWRFNRALFERLVSDGKLPKQPNQRPDGTSTKARSGQDRSTGAWQD